MLFATGKRPTLAAIRQFAAASNLVSISHDPFNGAPDQLVPVDSDASDTPAKVQPDQSDTLWLELLREGLTFDLHGLQPGSAREFPEIEHRFDLDEEPSSFRHEAIQLVPGRHLAGAETSLPITRGLVALARDFNHHFDSLKAVVWPPSKSAIGPRFFESTASAWLDGGAFPALGLTAFRATMDGAIQSVGLEYWIGQELRIEPPLSNDKVSATRLGVRIINQLVMVGGLEGSERLIAPDGSRLVMQTSRNNRFVRVRPE